jgi:hypothetical protein
MPYTGDGPRADPHANEFSKANRANIISFEAFHTLFRSLIVKLEVDGNSKVNSDIIVGALCHLNLPTNSEHPDKAINSVLKVQ